MKRLLYLALVLALLAACAPPPTTGPRPTPTSAPSQPGGAGSAGAGETLSADVPREAAPALEEAPVPGVVRGNTEFALDLYRRLGETHEGNLIFSPYSIGLAFAMTYAGARSETEAEMADVLGYLPQEEQHPAFNALSQYLDTLDEVETEGDPFQLSIINAVWGQEDYPFREAYLETLARYYGAGVRLVDFATQAAQIVETINAWVAEQTNDRITQLVDSSMITAATRLVLVNAIYFKGAWRFPFDPDMTTDQPFTLMDGSQVQVPLMHNSSEHLLYTEGEHYQAVELPYEGEGVKMLLLLPEQGHFATVEERLDADFLRTLRASLEWRDVEVKLPRFDFETELDLVEQLQALGLQEPFGSSADFSGIVEGGGLYIGAAVHQANITVDEEGTEAAAATAIMMLESAAMEVLEFTADDPFIFAIVEEESGAVLFLGRVMNPAQGR